MDTNTLVLVQAIGIFLALFGFWWRLDRKIDAVDTKLSGEIKEVRLASEAAHKEINEKLNAIEVTQAIHSERFNTVNERFNKVDEQFSKVDEQFNKVDEQFNKVDERFNKVDEQFKTVDERFNKVDEQFKTVDERFKTVKAQIKSVDDKVDRLREGR